jgi:hypothetical protein
MIETDWLIMIACYFADVHAASNCVLQILSSGVPVACVELLDEVQMKASECQFRPITIIHY